MCFIFFFKQKTAYEMRISDWSSDVCSSDLIGIEAFFLQARDFCVAFDAIVKLLDDRCRNRIGGTVERRADSGRQDEQSDAVAGHVSQRRRPDEREVKIGDGQIGGAACREGVGQLGWNWVVAGELKKK